MHLNMLVVCAGHNACVCVALLLHKQPVAWESVGVALAERSKRTVGTPRCRALHKWAPAQRAPESAQQPPIAPCTTALCRCCCCSAPLANCVRRLNRTVSWNCVADPMLPVCRSIFAAIRWSESAKFRANNHYATHTTVAADSLKE